MSADLTPQQYSLRYAARAIIAELCAPGLDALESLAMLRGTVMVPLSRARFDLGQAQRAAENHTAAEPEDPAADSWCGWCGGTEQLVNEALPLVALTADHIDPAQLWQDGPDDAWFCQDLDSCLARRKARYPDADTPELHQARDRLAAAKHAAQPALLALTALQLACSQVTTQAAAQGEQVALTTARQARFTPRMLTGAAYRAAQWSWTEAARRGR